MTHSCARAERPPQVEASPTSGAAPAAGAVAGLAVAPSPGPVSARHNLERVVALFANNRAALRTGGGETPHLDLAFCQRGTVIDDFVFGDVAFAEVDDHVRALEEGFGALKVRDQRRRHLARRDGPGSPAR